MKILKIDPVIGTWMTLWNCIHSLSFSLKIGVILFSPLLFPKESFAVGEINYYMTVGAPSIAPQSSQTTHGNSNYSPQAAFPRGSGNPFPGPNPPGIDLPHAQNRPQNARNTFHEGIIENGRVASRFFATRTRPAGETEAPLNRPETQIERDRRLVEEFIAAHPEGSLLKELAESAERYRLQEEAKRNPPKTPYPPGFNEEDRARLFDEPLAALANKEAHSFEQIEQLRELDYQILSLKQLKGRKSPDVQYLESELRRLYTNPAGLVKNLPLGSIFVPERPFPFLAPSSDQVFNRHMQNEALLSESLILQKIAQQENSAPFVQEFTAWSSDLNAAFVMADLLGYQRQEDAYNSLRTKLYETTQFLKGFAIGLKDGTIESALAITKLPEFIRALPDMGVFLFKALSGDPLTLRVIRNFIEDKYEQILTADAEARGEILGKLTAEVGGFIFGPQYVGQVLTGTSRVTRAIVHQALKASAEKALQTGLQAGSISDRFAHSFKALCQKVPQVAHALVHKEGSLVHTAEFYPALSTEAAEGLRVLTEKLPSALIDGLVKDPHGALFLGEQVAQNAEFSESLVQFATEERLLTADVGLSRVGQLAGLLGEQVVFDTQGVKATLESARAHWTSVKGLLHTVKGNVKLTDGAWNLKSGLHTDKGLGNFIKMNTGKSKNIVVKTVTSFGETNVNPLVILKQTLPNGVTRLQLPKEVWYRKQSFDSAYAKIGLQKIRGIKTLWPEHFSISDIAEATEAVIQQNVGSLDRKISGVFKGIQTKVTRDPSGKVITSFPSWEQ